MITNMRTKPYVCRKCTSPTIVKNGHNASGSQPYKCNDCGAHGVLEPRRGDTEEQREQIINASYERPRMRGVQRIVGVSRQTLAKWLKKDERNPSRERTLLPAQADDALEVDAMWSLVQKKSQNRWRWTVVCRRTRQMVAYVLGDRSEQTCLKLWQRIPEEYRRCHRYRDVWEAYKKVFPKEPHRCVGKETGQTNHMERWNNTVRQSNARYVRTTLSFSKSDCYHEVVTRIFIVRYNLSLIT